MAAADVIEEALGFACEGERLWGIVTRPGPAVPQARIVVVIAVGGPQYRVGSHRQFVLLARGLARRGFASLRFDYRGMGDSGGAGIDFRSAGPDLRAAIDAALAACPGADQVVVWGLCDAASAAMMFATQDPRVRGLVVANPWVRSEASLAAAHVRYYYRDRLLQPEFWAKLARGGLDWRGSLRSLWSSLRRARALGSGEAAATDDVPFQTAMARGLARFDAKVLLILSGRDLTAQEFREYTASSAAWKGVLDAPKIARAELADADHTFSTRAWRDEVERLTGDWLVALNDADLGARTARRASAAAA